MTDSLNNLVIAKMIQVIETTSRRGTGTDDDPVRLVRGYWSMDGELLAENDSESQMPEIKYGTVIKKMVASND